MTQGRTGLPSPPRHGNSSGVRIADDTDALPKKLTRAEQKARRPAQILDAAFEAFVERGYAATRMEDIAERIGVTKGTVYVYYRTKEDLFSAMIRHISTPFEEVREQAAAIEGSPETRLRGLIALFYDRIAGERTTREFLRLVIAEGARFPHMVDTHHDELIEPLIEQTRRIIEDGVRQGCFRPVSPMAADVVIAPAVLSMIFTLIFDQRRSLDKPGFIEAHLDLMLRGLKA